MRSAPARSTSATCWPRRAKSAARMEGASFMACSRDRRVVDPLNGCIEHGVVLDIRLLRGQPFDERPRKARDDAVIPSQPLVAFFLRIAARQCDQPVRPWDE